MLYRFSIYNPVHNILKLYNFLVQVRFTISKTKLDISYNKLGKNNVHELPNDLRFRKSRNQKILEKSRIWSETQLRAQSPFSKFNFGNSSQKCKLIFFQSCTILMNFFTLFQMIPEIFSFIFFYYYHLILIFICSLGLNRFVTILTFISMLLFLNNLINFFLCVCLNCYYG